MDVSQTRNGEIGQMVNEFKVNEAGVNVMDVELTGEYLASLPEVQGGGLMDSLGGRIERVGVKDLLMPFRYVRADGTIVELETRVDVFTSLRAGVRGVHMSRMVRILNDWRDEPIQLEVLGELLNLFCEAGGADSAGLVFGFRYPIIQRSLRSGLEGYQYYGVKYEAILGEDGILKKYMHFEFEYSSTCPCSAALCEHASETRGVYGVPHSQRSRACMKLELGAGAVIFPEDVQVICLRALKTETQVVVKREDEQAFAELNGAHTKFVEDAVRCLAAELSEDDRIKGYELVCTHYESLHSFNVEARMSEGM